ncbi:hypothetical protein OBBRIDRAFT_798846 [Obba rivulosa]|uniref:Uncharacterized protein n=1 Tax=Obba rivulosa TaxID=1052685 RepID=A0A8E2AT19_9APHY|nr:hypothetical protein OBBRIDRAFT_798846 [Obba rivulosa]
MSSRSGPALPQVSSDRFKALLGHSSFAQMALPADMIRARQDHEAMQAFQAQRQSAYCSSFLLKIIFSTSKSHLPSLPCVNTLGSFPTCPTCRGRVNKSFTG